MGRRLPPLNLMRSFEAVGRHGSIVEAARELNVTGPAVSRAIKSLEAHFGLTLFHRHVRGLELTEHGKIILPEVTQALDQISRASNMIYETRRYGLKVLATPMMASHLLAPVIGEFMRKHPDVSVHIHSSFRYEEIQSSDYDIAIWNGQSERHGFACEHFLSINRIPLCCKNLAAEAFSNGDIRLLETAPLLHEYDYSGWMDWFNANGLDPRVAANGLVSDNFNAILQATINGAGTALLFETYLDNPLFGSSLAAPFGHDRFVETHYWLYSRTDTIDNRAIERFVNYLQSKYPSP